MPMADMILKIEYLKSVLMLNLHSQNSLTLANLLMLIIWSDQKSPKKFQMDLNLQELNVMNHSTDSITLLAKAPLPLSSSTTPLQANYF